MPYRIEEKDDLLEVRIWGDLSKWDVLKIIFTLRQKAPRKEKSDLWLIGDDAIVPYDTFSFIISNASRMFPPKAACSKSAFVADSEFQRAQVELYCSAAKAFPFEIQIFTARADAVQWLRT
jgi:hypothetical protein